MAASFRIWFSIMKTRRSFILLLGPHFNGEGRAQIDKAARIFKFKNFKVEELEQDAGMRRIRITDGARRDDLK